MSAPSVEERNVDPATLSQLRQEVVELYVDKIPRKMKKAGFAMKQMHSCFEKLVDGMDRFTSWRETKEKSRNDLETVGFTTCQLDCLRDMEAVIKTLETKGKAAAPLNYERLRSMTCTLMCNYLSAVTYGANEEDADRERNLEAKYVKSYWSLGHELDEDKESTVLRPTFKETLTHLNGGFQQTVDEMIALLSADFSTPQSGPRDATSHTSIRFRHGSDMSVGNLDTGELLRLGNTPWDFPTDPSRDILVRADDDDYIDVI